MKIFPELEAYRGRLVEKCAVWPETPPDKLLAELHQTLDQSALLDKGIAGLRRRIEEARPADPERLLHRVAVQEQMRDLTHAYAEVLKRHIDGQAS